jgi:hypothetical protein
LRNNTRWYVAAGQKCDDAQIIDEAFCTLSTT